MQSSGNPAKYDMRIYAGASFSQTLLWQTGEPPAPVDLTGATARMQVRRPASAALPLLELTTENGRIELVGVTGKINMLLSPVDTGALAFEVGLYSMEIQLADGTVRRLIEGSITVSPEITR